MTTPRCARIQTNAELIEDYAHQLVPPLAKNLADRFVAIQRQTESNRSDLLTVSPDNQLVLFSADPKNRVTWTESRSPVPDAPAGPIKKIVAFHRGERLHALVHFPHPDGESSKVMVLERDGEEWISPTLDTQTKLLIGQTEQMNSYTDAAGRLLIYGVSTMYDDPFAFICTYREAKGKQKGGWTNLWKERRETTGSFSIIPGRKPNEVKVLEVFNKTVKLRGAKFTGKKFQWVAGDEIELNLPTQVAKVLPFVSKRLSDSFTVQSADGEILLVSHYYDTEPTITPLTGGTDGPKAVASIQVGIDHTGRTILFAVESDTAELWILRQNEDGDDPFLPWTPLGNACAEIASPVAMADAAEVYIASLDARVINLSQDHVDAVWSQSILDTPKPLKEGVEEETTYKWEVRALDKYGLPAPNTVVKVKGSATIGVLGNGLAAVVDRNHEEAFQTDGAGVLTLTAKATTLTSPELYVRIPDYMTPDESNTLWADERLTRRLAGHEPGFPVDAASLKKNGVVPQKMPEKDTGDVATALTASGQFMQAKRNEALTGVFNEDGIDHPAWRLTFSDDAAIAFHALSPGEIESARQGFAAAGLFDTNALGGSNPWGDFVHWFVNAAKKLFEVLAYAKDGILYVTIRFADGVKDFALASVAQAGRLLDAIFQGIKAAYQATADFFKKAIEWLRMVFDWSDIVRTADFIGDKFSKTITSLADLIEKSRPPIESFFDGVIDSVEQQFDHLESALGKEGDLSTLFGSSSASDLGVSRNLEDDTYSKAHASNAVQCNFLSSKMPAGGQGIKIDESVLAGSAGEQAFGDFEQIAKELIQALDLASLKKSFGKIQSAVAEIHDAESFLHSSLLILLEVIKDAIVLVLKAVKVVLSTLMDWVAKGLIAIVDLLNATIYVPVVTEILATKGIKLSIVGLTSLLIGFFVTVMYKVLHGRAPRPEDDATPLLPPLYTIRTVSYGAKYAGAWVSDPDLPAPPTVNFPSYIEVFAAVLTAGIENFPSTKDRKLPSDASHVISTALTSISVAIGIGHFLNMRRAKMKPKEALGMDILVSEIQGIIEVFGAIAYTAECYLGKDVNPNTQARMAKSYLTAFPDAFWPGAMDKDPVSSAIVGVIAVASYVGATVASAFVETNI